MLLLLHVYHNKRALSVHPPKIEKELVNVVPQPWTAASNLNFYLPR